MAITIEVEKRDDVSVLRLKGDLGHDEGLKLVAAANKELTARGAKAVLELSGVSYLSSAGISALVRVVAQANTQEQQVVLAQLTPFVEGVFATTRLNRFFAIYPGVEEALLAFGA